MSKLLDLLQRSKGEIADAVRPMVAAAVQSEGPPLTSGNTEAAKERPTTAPSLSRLRTVRLHVPAPSPILPFENGQWRPSEQYRMLRTEISHHAKQPRLIVITSPESGDGKSVTAINTAGALALKSEGQVLLVDADLRKSAIHTELGIPNAPGLAEVLTGRCSAEEAMVRTLEFPNLYVLSAGATPSNPVELLDSAQWRSLCTGIRGMFRYVIIDSPPVGVIADYELIQAVCDGVILVLRPDFTNRHLTENALEHVPKAKLLGVVMNCVPDWAPAKNTGSNYYYYTGEKSYSSKRFPHIER